MYLELYDFVVTLIGDVPTNYEFIYLFCLIFAFLCVLMPFIATVKILYTFGR